MKSFIRWVQFGTLVIAVLFYAVAIAEEPAGPADKKADDFRNRVSLFGGMNIGNGT